MRQVVDQGTRHINISALMTGSGPLTVDVLDWTGGGTSHLGKLTLSNADNTWNGDLILAEPAPALVPYAGIFTTTYDLFHPTATLTADAGTWLLDGRNHTFWSASINGVFLERGVYAAANLNAFEGTTFSGLGSISILIPEPTSLALLALGLLGLTRRRRRA